MSDEKDIELRTEEVTEILTAAPRWLLRWGISVIFILIVVGIMLSYFIRYPDILTAEITLTTLNPPVTLVSKTNGKLTQLLVANKQSVKAKQPIAVIENTANYQNVLYLDEALADLAGKIKLSDSLPHLFLRDSLRVGELTPVYLLMVKSIKDLNLYKAINPYSRQITLLKKDLINYSDLLAKYKKQEVINKEQLTLIEGDYNRDKNLYDNKIISAREYDTKKKDYLGALSNYENIRITLSNNLIQVNAIEKDILQLQIQDYQEQTKLKTELQQNLQSAISQVDQWKQTYLVQSPVDGRVSFFNVWSVNQNIKQGDELFSIIPSQKQHFIGKCMLPIANTGKLRVGQKVNIKLNNYPYNENGMLQGTVLNISEVPNKEMYAIDVSLNNGLVTSYHIILPYKEEMKGTADIVTQNLSVMDRVFFNFRKLLDRK